MRFEFKTLVIAKEQKVSKTKGNHYNVISFMDGAQPIQAMLTENVNYEAIPLLKESVVTVNITLGKFTKVTVENVKPV